LFSASHLLGGRVRRAPEENASTRDTSQHMPYETRKLCRTSALEMPHPRSCSQAVMHTTGSLSQPYCRL
jgi:hypothetical protein